MKKRLMILALALTAVTAFALVAVLNSGSPGQETQVGQLPAVTAAEVETSRAAPTAEPIAPAPTVVTPEVTEEVTEAITPPVRPEVADSTQIETSRAAPTAEPIAPAPTVVTPEVPDSTEEARPLTGCGRPTPCPNRDCEDCPYNIYLQ